MADPKAVIIAQLTEEYEAQERDLEAVKDLYARLLNAATAALLRGEEEDTNAILIPLHEAARAAAADTVSPSISGAFDCVPSFVAGLERRLKREAALQVQLAEANRELGIAQTMLAASQAREEAAAAAAPPSSASPSDDSPASPGKTSALAAALEAEALAEGERARMAEERAAQLEKQLSMISSAYEGEASALRAKLADGEASRLQLTSSLSNLRKEVDEAHAASSAKDGVISMLREELATAQAKLSKLQLSKAEIASSAAATMKEMEAQLGGLTSAIVALKKEQESLQRAKRGSQGGAPAPTPDQLTAPST